MPATSAPGRKWQSDVRRPQMAVTAQQLNRARLQGIEYPTGDGKPMAETQKHGNLMIYAISALTVHFADRPEVYVAGNNFLYYEEGNPKRRVAPDVYVVFGVGNQVRDSYKVWEEGNKAPDVVMEFTSKSTRAEDTSRKFRLYERLGVSEYVLFDPTRDYLNPPLRGYRLVNGRYAPIPLEGDRLYSEQLQLEIVWEDERIRFYDPQQDRWLPSMLELSELAEAEARRAEEAARRMEAEAKARAAAEAELQRLRAELSALKRGEG